MRAQTQERGPPSAPVEFSVILLLKKNPEIHIGGLMNDLLLKHKLPKQSNVPAVLHIMVSW